MKGGKFVGHTNLTVKVLLMVQMQGILPLFGVYQLIQGTTLSTGQLQSMFLTQKSLRVVMLVEEVVETNVQLVWEMDGKLVILAMEMASKLILCLLERLKSVTIAMSLEEESAEDAKEMFSLFAKHVKGREESSALSN